MKDIIVFCDGAVKNNQIKNIKHIGGIGVFFNDKDKRNFYLKIKETKILKITNNICEILACIHALNIISFTELLNNTRIIIYTDSEYVINSMTKWGEKHYKIDWKDIKNAELLKKLYFLSKNLNVEYKHVHSHTKEPSKNDPNYFIWYGNNQADKLANKAIK
jgi:ribonuclease HI